MACLTGIWRCPRWHVHLPFSTLSCRLWATPHGTPGQGQVSPPKAPTARTSSPGFPANSHELSAQINIFLGRKLVRTGWCWSAIWAVLQPRAESAFLIGACWGPVRLQVGPTQLPEAPRRGELPRGRVEVVCEPEPQALSFFLAEGGTECEDGLKLACKLLPV